MNAISPQRRYPSGGKKPASAVQAGKDATEAAWLAGTEQAASQPHRNGDRSPMAGSELGRFIIRHITAAMCLTDASELGAYRKNVMDACERFGAKVRYYNIQKGIPMPGYSDEGSAGGLALDDPELQRRLANDLRAIKDCENALKAAGLPAFHAARALIVFDTPVPGGLEASVRRALQSLAAFHSGISRERLTHV